MKLLKAFLLILLVGVAEPAFSKDWTLVAQTNDHSFHAIAETFSVANIGNNVPVFVVVGKAVEKKTKKESVAYWIVAVDHCLAGAGKFFIADKDGTIIGEADYTKGGNTAASMISDVLCKVGVDLIMTPSKNRI